MNKQRSQYFLTTLEKGFDILKLFNKERTSLSLTEISNCLNIHKASAYRFVETLIEMEYLRRDRRTKQIKLGTQAFYLAHGFMQSFDIRQIIKPFVDEA